MPQRIDQPGTDSGADADIASRVTAALGTHYARVFGIHGATDQGVDWGKYPEDALLRHKKMLEVIVPSRGTGAVPTLLDVGCGYGALLDYAKNHGVALDYQGIDVCGEMIEAARNRHPEARFVCTDIFRHDAGTQFDYVVCNGILTQKLEISISEMNAFAGALIKRLFAVARIGVAFNVMSSFVNFTASNLYYRSPAELLAWCMSEVTPRIRLDHAYPLYEFTLYLYRPNVSGIEPGSHRTVASAGP